MCSPVYRPRATAILTACCQARAGRRSAAEAQHSAKRCGRCGGWTHTAGQEMATPRPRPTRIPALRVRVSRSGFSDRPSLACRKPWTHPCGEACGRIDRFPPLPRGPGQSAGSCPPKPKPKRGDPIGWVLTHRTSTLASVASTRVGCACRASPATSRNPRRAIPTGHVEERCMRGAHVAMNARVAASFDSGQASFERVRARHASPMRVVSSSPAPSPPAAPARRSPAG
jgi:hypothetical protein